MSDGESKGHKERPYWLPFVIAAVMLLWLTYLYFTPEAVDRTDFTFVVWKNIGYLVIVIMLLWLFIWKITLSTEVVTEAEAVAIPEEQVKGKARTRPAEEEEEEEPEERPPPKKRPKRVVVKAPASPDSADDEDGELSTGIKAAKKPPEEDLKDLPRVIEWESKEPGGVYSDTLIRVDDNLVLNLRTLLGKVCHNCEEQEDCRRRILGKVDEDIFLWNFECKEGLKRELHKARKKREREEAKAAVAKEMVERKASSKKKASSPAKRSSTKKKASSPAKRSSTKRKASTKRKTSSSGGKKKGTSKDE
jgi:hypothetical protein